MIGPNVLSYGVINSRILNVFNEFSSYLIDFIIRSQLFSKILRVVIKLAAFVGFCLFVAESH